MQAIKNINPVVESLVRYLLALAMGYVGVEAVQEQTNGAVAAISAVVVGGISIAWSKYSDKKVADQAVTK